MKLRGQTLVDEQVSAKTETDFLEEDDYQQVLWPYGEEKRLQFLAKVREEKADAIDNIDRNKKNLSSERDDGSNGTDDLLCSSRFSEDHTSLMMINLYQTKLQQLERVERQVGDLTFYPKCSCGQYIAFERLMLVPASKLCSECCRKKQK